MISRTQSSTRRLCAGLLIGAVATLILLSPVVLPPQMVFAQGKPRSPVATAIRPIAQRNVEIVGTLEVLHGGPGGRNQPESPRPVGGRRNAVVAGWRAPCARSADRSPGASQGQLDRGPGRRTGLEHVWLAENHRDPRELLERSRPALHGGPGGNRLRGGRQLVPRSLLPANLARHRRRRLVHVAGHQRKLRPFRHPIPGANRRDRRRRQPLDVRAPGLCLPVQCQLPLRGVGDGRRRPVERMDQWQYEHGHPRPRVRTHARALSFARAQLSSHGRDPVLLDASSTGIPPTPWAAASATTTLSRSSGSGGSTTTCPLPSRRCRTAASTPSTPTNSPARSPRR